MRRGGWVGRVVISAATGLVVAVVASACASTTASQVAPAVSAAVEQTVEPTAVETVELSPDRVEAAATVFLAEPTRANANGFLDAVQGHGSSRWVPWLVDLLRANVSSGVSLRSGEILQQLTGLSATRQRIANLNLFGSWIHDNDAVGGDGYRQWKQGLYGRFDADFTPLIASLATEQDLAALQWGGVPRGGIPELNSQSRQRGAEADWMVPDEVVFGVEIDGEAVAFPLRILARHELANDVVGGVPVSVVYCTLCRSALLFDRRVNDDVLDFQTSGLLIGSNKVMVDRQTDTLWQHLRGEAIGGQLLGTSLQQLAMDTIRWSDWLEAHPDTEVIERPAPVFFDDPERPPLAYDYTPGEAYAFYYDSEELFFPAAAAPDTFDAKAEVIGIEHNGDSLALELAALYEVGSVEVTVGGEGFVVESTGAGARVFTAAGERRPVEQSFWFAWYANHEDTRIWPPK